MLVPITRRHVDLIVKTQVLSNHNANLMKIHKLIQSQ
jgi:hypothetical protein